MANGLLNAIINPAQVDVLGALDKGRERQAKDLAGKILSETIGGKIGALSRLSPEMGMKIAKLTNTPTDSKGRMDKLIGSAVMFSQVYDDGKPELALQVLRDEIAHIDATTGRSADNLKLIEVAMMTGDQETVDNFLSVGRAANPLNKAMKPTSLQQNLAAGGLTPGTPEFQEAILKNINKPGTTINLGGEGLSEERKALAKGRVSQLTKFREQREVAIDANQSLDVLESIDVKTGALEPAKQGLAAFGKAFGIDTSGLANVAKGEAFNAEAQRIVLSVKASQKGPQTDKDEATIRQTVASLGNTTEGNQFIIDSAKALNNRRIGQADFYDLFLEENETLKGANRAWSKFKRDTPMVSSVMRTPQGLPVFFWKFEQSVRNAHPDATRPEILELWRQANKKKTGAK